MYSYHVTPLTNFNISFFQQYNKTTKYVSINFKINNNNIIINNLFNQYSPRFLLIASNIETISFLQIIMTLHVAID